jgi:hypothetical protein
MPKAVYSYFVISYDTTTSPESLQLGAGNPVVRAPRQIAADEYQFTQILSFPDRTPNGASFADCTKDTEA